jgi:hypothetical protein
VASVSAAAAAPAPAADAHCRAVAAQRADDARASGMDSDMQQIVRDGTFRNCMAWQMAHPSPP